MSWMSRTLDIQIFNLLCIYSLPILLIIAGFVNHGSNRLSDLCRDVMRSLKLLAKIFYTKLILGHLLHTYKKLQIIV
jgi:hypothetical protein